MPLAEPPSTPTVLEAPALDVEQIGRERVIIDFTIVRPRCPEGKPNEIVVCAPDNEARRARRLTETYGVSPRRAKIDIRPDVSLDAHFDSETLPNGYNANRIMVGVKFKF